MILMEVVKLTNIFGSRMLYSLLYFVEQAYDCDINVNLDVPVRQLFCKEFDYYCFRNVIANLILHHGILLKEVFFDDGFSLRQLSRCLESAERVPEDSFPDLLKMIAGFILENEEERFSFLEKNNDNMCNSFVH